MNATKYLADRNRILLGLTSWNAHLIHWFKYSEIKQNN